MGRDPMFSPGPGASPDYMVLREDGLKRESSAPCQLNCPAEIDVPSYIALIGQENTTRQSNTSEETILSVGLRVGVHQPMRILVPKALLGQGALYKGPQRSRSQDGDGKGQGVSDT